MTKTKITTWRVDIDIDLNEKLSDFMDMLAEFESRWRVASYDAATGRMVLEFKRFVDAVSFAQTYFREDDSEDAKEYVETVTH